MANARQRFQANCARVKLLNFRKYDGVLSHLRNLRLHSPADLLLPHLKWLTFKDVTDEMLVFLPMFLAGQLRTITLHSGLSSNSACAILSQITQLCPDIRHVRARCGLPNDSVRQLSALPRLREIYFRSVDGWSNIETCFKSISLESQQLEVVKVTYQGYLHPPTVDSVLTSASVFTSMVVLGLSVASGVWSNPGSYDIQPLLQLSRLRSLTLGVSFNLLLKTAPLTEEHIPVLAQAWPKMVFLDIIRKAAPMLRASPENIYPTFTLQSLEAFATHFPRLRLLVIDLDTSTPEELVPPAVQRTGTITLGLAHNALERARWLSIAEYISNLYPKVCIARKEDVDVEEEYMEQWAGVLEAIPVFSRAREEAVKSYVARSRA